MSLASASSTIGGIKEYVYRGLQQLPIVLASTSLLFTITTGSMAHALLALGLIVVVPLYTIGLQLLIPAVLAYFGVNPIIWNRSTDDSCSIIKPPAKLSAYETLNKSDNSVPSFWLTSIGFFIGYAVSNAADSLMTPSAATAESENVEKRKTQAIYVIVSTVLFFVAVLFIRFRAARGCEGSSLSAGVLSFLTASLAAVIGYAMYGGSRKCGARTSDLFGILSQILPTSATTPNPVVCMAS